MSRRLSIVAAILLLTSPACGSQPQAADAAPSPKVAARAWPPASDIAEIELWPKPLAIARPEVDGAERIKTGGSIGGAPVTSVWNVARPTMAIYKAKGRATGAALFVYPGGGYKMLAIDLEGSEVCDWITAKGVACIVLKYRVPQTWWPGGGQGQRAPRVQMALQDAQRAMGLLRRDAKSFGIDPHKIGVLGFSAGGHLVTAISNAAGRSYDPVDTADRESARPDFAIALYPGHLWSGKGMELYPFDPIRADAPPTFLLQAQDDPVDDVRHSIAYFLALREAGVPVEMHIYPTGGHAFGLRPTKAPVAVWPRLVEQWLRGIGML